MAGIEGGAEDAIDDAGQGAVQTGEGPLAGGLGAVGVGGTTDIEDVAQGAAFEGCHQGGQTRHVERVAGVKAVDCEELDVVVEPDLDRRLLLNNRGLGRGRSRTPRCAATCRSRSPGRPERTRMPG